MPTAPNRGFGRIPFGRGLFGRAMTVDGDNDAEIVPLDLDTDLPAGEGSSGVSAEVVAADLVVAGQAAKAGAIRQLPDTVEWSKP